ncbi:EAP30 subunit of ELL complex, putative [Trichomonas vaginalis G3]|uniref:EAP30 subunit of ELL complex, putative n=1 Tax=Trichomonas vaginalis (strain ATCC PRA-98 / G3) TaxID=412133 RepID=A2FSC0_TRIV3|nr:protein transport to vacuole protein [Trichomonas vaginalis G3]EAX92207.1 EAP30 subunit of ELL complex, putative [Trichomonas vaginalis G3]KAI5543993.1 protein transport to vacuole protein [Trichomonas vaginalis G3]|eukprot:XP_001305137.1 EAP30 subunit of ELL complex [Trichomonas vaginalis G3]
MQGLGAIQANQARAEYLEQARDLIENTRNEAAKEQMRVFKEALEKFAINHKKDLKDDPEFRSSFNNMCLNLGVDPLQSTKGFWSSILGVGDFYHELSIKVIDVCLKQKKANGGILPIEDVLKQVQATYKNPPKMNTKDIEQALKNLKVLGSGYCIVEIGKKKFMKTTSFDIDEDQTTLLALAEGKGYFTEKDASGMSQKRFEAALQTLLDQGFVWLDLYNDEKKYYVCAMFPGFNQEV